ncbi:MAG: hypothetical protein H6996_01590 [Moraxellaceae bacterium]|nr:hypothetical protein [Moraxellaceae bacterium]MCP5176900.1 hypothetical protein [Moraxellaceae bacterium]HQV22065.1 hypothetical protein [Agitococcus sp.]
MTMVPLSPVDAKQIHQQILQLENLHRDMIAHDSVNANTVASTIKLLHHIEDELRQRARIEHQH